MSPQQVKAIQMKAARTPVIKKRENGTENLRRIKRRRKRNINVNIGNHQKALTVTVIQEKGIQRRRGVNDKLFIIKWRLKETGRVTWDSALLVYVNEHVVHVHECSSSIHARQWLERRKQNLDIMNLGGCLVTMDVVFLNFPVSMDFVPLWCLRLFGCLLGSDFMKESHVQKQLLAFLSEASRPSFRNGWYQLELLIRVKRHWEEWGAFVENAARWLIYIGTDK